MKVMVCLPIIFAYLLIQILDGKSCFLSFIPLDTSYKQMFGFLQNKHPERKAAIDSEWKANYWN